MTFWLCNNGDNKNSSESVKFPFLKFCIYTTFSSMRRHSEANIWNKNKAKNKQEACEHREKCEGPRVIHSNLNKVNSVLCVTHCVVYKKYPWEGTVRKGLKRVFSYISMHKLSFPILFSVRVSIIRLVWTPEIHSACPRTECRTLFAVFRLMLNQRIERLAKNMTVCVSGRDDLWPKPG